MKDGVRYVNSVKIDSHKCFIQIENRKKEETKKPKGFIFFDYECYVDDLKNHVPNLIMAKKINFKNKDEDYTIDDTKYTFNNNQSFCKWLLSKKHKNYIGIAHNLKGNLIIFQNLVI